MLITADRLRELFDSELPDPQLAVVEGQARVVPGTTNEDQGLVVASRSDLLDQHGGTAPSGEVLEQLAVTLDTTVGTLGA
ncbi:MAG: hypothetical protein JWP64_1750 [Pseudonocardia sp.]|jgi:hypothetical protein|uniref:hypothetical protein n=1 Tax=Pseudonocardia sp. TaxID=60912 RepID=UPI00262B3DEE|nr:hypothetical protein [Pseudonocardia sp.]MCU1626801.1 hypothetical protein [Pseudonocardia sp.]MDT7701441.1 hypothetical protein [Pseudonocardiales bacterium]